MRKTPVEAIQWNGHNLQEVSEFVSLAAKSYSMWNDDFGNLDMTYSFQKGRTSRAVIPLFGWVVKDGKSFEFYKDATFRKTFEEVPDDGSKGIDWEGMDKTIKEVFDCFDNTIKDTFDSLDDVFKGFNHVSGAEPSKKTLDTIRMRAYIDPNNPLAKMVDDIYSEDGKIREQAKKMLSEDTNKATFESVLDEMKELHAKKDKDYGSAFHKSFEEFGVTAGVVRLNDKMERVKSLVKNGKAEVKDDSLLDSLKDLGCYAVMLYVELKNKENGADKD